MKTKLLPAILLATISFLNADAQVFTMPQTGSQTVTTCGGMFYDSGGAGGNYSNNENGIIVFCSALPGHYVSITFTSMALLDNGDILRLYSGTGTGGPLLQTFQGPLNTTSFCGTVVSQDTSGGCLTAQFISNFSGVAAGWNAQLSCNPTPSVLIAGTTCANPVVINIPYSASFETTCCYINDFTNQSGICNATYNGEDKVYQCATSGPEYTCITMSNTTGNPALAIYQGCPGAGGVCLTPTPLVGNNSMQFTFPTAGTYYIIVDAPSGCADYDLDISLCTGIEEANSNPVFSISPNPSSGKFTIDNPAASSQIIITNIIGEKVSEQSRVLGTEKIQINFSEQPAGIYFVLVKSEKQAVTKKIVIQK